MIIIHTKICPWKDTFQSCSLRSKTTAIVVSPTLPECQSWSFNLLREGPGFKADMDSHEEESETKVSLLLSVVCRVAQVQNLAIGVLTWLKVCREWFN